MVQSENPVKMLWHEQTIIMFLRMMEGMIAVQSFFYYNNLQNQAQLASYRMIYFQFLKGHSHESFLKGHSQESFLIGHSQESFLKGHSHESFLIGHSHESFLIGHSHESFYRTLSREFLIGQSHESFLCTYVRGLYFATKTKIDDNLRKQLLGLINPLFLLVNLVAIN